MKNKSLTLLLTILTFLIMSLDLMAQGIKKEMNVGYIRWKVIDSADEGEGSLGWGVNTAFWDGYTFGLNSSKSVMLGCRDWTDTLGVQYSIKISGNGQWEVDDKHIMMPVVDKEGWTIKRYYRVTPPAITVDGLRMDDPFPINYADEINPSKIPGTADGLIESVITTDMGVTIHYRTIAFAQKNHNKYLIREYIFKNTGIVSNIPGSKTLNKTINGFYFLRQYRGREEPQKPWSSSYGEKPGEDIRISYVYPGRQKGNTYDDFAAPNLDKGGFLEQTYYAGEAILFASKSPSQFNVDDVNQPQMTGYFNCDFPSFTFQPMNMEETQRQTLYQVMKEGLVNIQGIFWPEMTGAKPGHHGVRLDERGFSYPEEMEDAGWTQTPAYSVGPYDLAFGDSIKVVIADCLGTISPEKAYEVGQAWANNTSTWGDNIPGGTTDKLPPQYKAHPNLYAADTRSQINNWAKDNWVATGKDSLFMTARAAQWAFRNNYNVPSPPPPPSVTVKSLPEYIDISWGSESESASDFAGYRVYRSLGSWYPTVPENETALLGKWEKIYENRGAAIHDFQDNTAQRGNAYFYAVTAFDNGTSNGTDFNGKQESLESNFIANASTKAAFLLKPGGTLSDIVVVPNPYNLAASSLQFPGEPNKIMFLNVPSFCTIRIFTERGDLVKTIEHAGSGDASWGDIPAQHMATETGQMVVSGIYIAKIETPDGQSTIRKFVIVR